MPNIRKTILPRDFCLLKPRLISKNGGRDEVNNEDGQLRDSHEHLRDLSVRALNGMTALDFRDRMLSSLRTYKAMSTLDYGTRPVFQPYLRRNLLYLRAFADRNVPSYTFGEDVPPLLWPWKPVRTVVRRSTAERQAHLDDIIDVLLSRNSADEKVQKFAGVHDFRFSVGTLAAFRKTMDVQVLHRCLAYRKFLSSHGVTIPSFPRKHNHSSNGSSIENYVHGTSASVDSVTLSFRMVFHNFLEGERLAKVQVYTVQQQGDVFGKVERLPSATFTVSVNAPMQPVSIDVPTISSDQNLRVFVIVRVDVTNNLKGIRVDGHALRNLPTRMRTDCVNRDHKVTFEHTLFGARCLYRMDGALSKGGFIVGENNVTLIEQDKLSTDISSPAIVSELEHWSKRLHTNPFLQMRVACGPTYDDDSDCCSSNRSSRSWDGVDGDDELSACSEREEAAVQRIEVKRAIDPYLGIFSPDEDGRYVNHIRTIETIFHPLKHMGRINLMLVQNWLRLEIPPTIIYRISSGIAPRECCDEPSSTCKENQIPKIQNSTFATLTEVEEMGWITIVDQRQTDRCIICERCLLVNRKVVFEDPQQDERWHRLHIDVFLNPDFDDVHEMLSYGKRSFIRARDPTYTWTRDQAIELRTKARMDLTIFCDSLKSAGQSLDDPVEEQRFIHPESGRWLYRGERLPHYARHLPAPGHEVLIHSTTRRLLDFVDLSDGSKWFMITWNTMMVTLGKARCDEAGPYWLNRLFLELHMDTMIRYGQRSHFLYQLNTHTQRGRPIADLEDLVLRLYHAKHDYDPLLDELHPLRDWIYSDLKRGYERFCSEQDKPHRDSSGMRRFFPKMYRTDPATMSSQQLHKLFIEILEAGAVVPFSHPFRKYLLNVVDVLFGGEMPPCIAHLRDQDDIISELIRRRDV
ncbi:unnamed protein product [Strongylus vulgaris]|uniref:Uncharacterized protein n=1 Tax=Strongylus vulgaris TaxID=40348 RepID=A0A3P7L6P9_STRVU|nr:unnamed protein product [Strongylus vulgaris]